MIDSVIMQSYSNWEMIIIDNHSNDNTDQIISQYNDARIKCVKINNGGVVAISRNKGIQEASGEWIAFLDSDDGWEQNKLAECMSVADGADLVYHDMNVYQSDKGFILSNGLTSRKLFEPVFKDLLIGGNTIINSSAVIRKSLINEVGGLSEDRELVTAEDYNLWLKVAQKTERFVHLPRKLGFYTVHADGLSQRDTSLQYRKAISEFETSLTLKERAYVESCIRYFKLRSMLFTSVRSNFLSDFIYCFINGKLNIKIKSLFTIFYLLFVTVKNICFGIKK